MSQQIFSGTHNEEGLLTSGMNLSYWLDSVEPLIYTPLNESISTDTVVVGGGISGLSVAYCLAKAGIPVVVLEDGFLGSGETGRTTAHLVNALDDRYSIIEKRLGKDMAALAAASHSAAIDFVEMVVTEENIDCDFRRLNGYLFLHPSDNLQTLKDEHHATHRAGISTEWVESVPGISPSTGPCLRFPNQAQFHPVKYIKGLADAIVKYGGRIFTETSASGFEKDKLKANGFTVNAINIVVATNSPVNDLVTMHTKQHPYRTYVIGALIPKNTIAPALWWDTGDMNSTWVAEPYHYVRLQPYDENFDLLISGGEDHKTGQADKENIPEPQRFGKLLAWTKDHFPTITEVIYKWSGQVLEPVDCMAFIGRNPGDKNTFIATGDSGNGMTHGTVAGMLISGLITKGEHPWEKLYDPSRITVKATKDFIQEVGNMAVQYLDYLAPGDIKTLKELKAGHGAVMNMDAKKMAVYRDEHNVLHAFSAICPHLGCIVQWNESENSFDCPCHGSRFTCEGKVVNGPSASDLKKIVLKS